MTHKTKTQTPLFEPRHKGLVEAIATPEMLAKIRGTTDGAGDKGGMNRSTNTTPIQTTPPERASRVLIPPPTADIQNQPDQDDVRRRESQNHELLKALERGETITVSTARVICGTWRFMDRMEDVRGKLERRGELGRLVQTGTGVRAKYNLRNPGTGLPGGPTP